MGGTHNASHAVHQITREAQVYVEVNCFVLLAPSRNLLVQGQGYTVLYACSMVLARVGSTWTVLNTRIVFTEIRRHPLSISASEGSTSKLVEGRDVGCMPALADQFLEYLSFLLANITYYTKHSRRVPTLKAFHSALFSHSFMFAQEEAATAMEQLATLSKPDPPRFPLGQMNPHVLKEARVN